jgi:hypothetical protein
VADAAHRPGEDVGNRLGDRILVIGQGEGVPGRQIWVIVSGPDIPARAW